MSIAIILDMAKQAKEALAQPNRLYPLNVGIAAEAIIQAAEEIQELQKELNKARRTISNMEADYNEKTDRLARKYLERVGRREDAELKAGHDVISATMLNVRDGPIDRRINELVGVIMNDLHRVYDVVGKMLEDQGVTPVVGLPGDKFDDLTLRRLAQLQESHKAQVETSQYMRREDRAELAKAHEMLDAHEILKDSLPDRITDLIDRMTLSVNDMRRQRDNLLQSVNAAIESIDRSGYGIKGVLEQRVDTILATMKFLDRKCASIDVERAKILGKDAKDAIDAILRLISPKE